MTPVDAGPIHVQTSPVRNGLFHPFVDAVRRLHWF